MYTELYLSVTLKKDTPEETLAILRAMTAAEDTDELNLKLPDHPLFKTDRWPFMLRCSSFYHTPIATMRLIEGGSHTGEAYLIGRCDLKDYNGEIKKFIDWLTPYIAAEPGEHLGHRIYEETETPTLLYHPNDWKKPVVEGIE